MDLVQFEQTFVDGVRVEIMRPSAGRFKGEIVFVHGGYQGSWTFEKMQPYFAEAG